MALAMVRISLLASNLSSYIVTMTLLYKQASKQTNKKTKKKQKKKGKSLPRFINIYTPQQ